jgi:hypothetical protein
MVTQAQAKAPTLGPLNIGLARSAPQTRPMTPTQYRLLRSTKEGQAYLTEARLAELSKQTAGYMDNVVEQFRNGNKGRDPYTQAVFYSPATSC